MLLKEFVIAFQPIKIHSSILYKKLLHNKTFKITEIKKFKVFKQSLIMRMTKLRN